jgi:hypothetical protein
MLTNEEQQAQILTFGQWLIEVGRPHAAQWFPDGQVEPDVAAFNIAFSIAQALLGAFNERRAPLIDVINGLGYAIGGCLAYASPAERSQAIGLLNDEVKRAVADVLSDLQPKGRA